MTTQKNKALEEALIKERAKLLKAYDDAYPDVGFGLSLNGYIPTAREQLKNEGLI